MYAAMPAILKNAVIKAYEKCGWDITNSYIPGRKMEYPCFADVLECINEILETSAFSDDNKGDYTGALCTRVESLTTGMNGQIFIKAKWEQLIISMSDCEVPCVDNCVEWNSLHSCLKRYIHIVDQELAEFYKEKPQGEYV